MTEPDRASAVLIRDVAEGDVERIIEIEQEVFGRSAWSPGLVREQFRYGFSRWRGVDGPDALAAYAIYGFDGDAFHLMNLVVEPESRGRGVGAALMADFMAEARRLGAAEAWLEVAVTNDAALALYRQFGFEDVRVRSRYYQPEGLDALVMRARLT